MSDAATSVDFEAARARLDASRERAALCGLPRPPRTAPPATPAVDVPRPHRAPVRNGTRSAGPRGSRLPDDVQAWILDELANGASLNALANALGVTRDRIRVVRDGESVRSRRYYADRRKATK